MRLIVALLCVASALSSAPGRKSDAFYLEASKLFVSEASTHFVSPEEFVSSHREFETRINNRENKLNGKAHPYVVELTEKCDADCHSKLLEFFTPAKYRIYNSHHSTVYASLDDIEKFQAAHPKVLSDFAPIHPDMKVHADVRKISSLTHGCYPSVLKTKTTTANDELNVKAPEHRIRVELMPLESSQEVEEFLEYTRDLRKQHKNQFSFEFALKQKHTRAMVGFLVSNRCEKISGLVNALAQRREVKWMEIDYPTRVHNRWSRGICDVADADYTPLTEEGLLGDDEVIGVSDTGLDLTSCYFHDSNFNSSNPFKYQYTDTTVLNPTHRKVLQYRAYIDNRDDTEAHGTHVCGSAAGQSDITIGSFQLYNGMAYNAKLSFFDIGGGNLAEGSVSTPGDIENDLFDIMYPSGARIFTNSWGTGVNVYDSKALDVDQFMWNNPEALVLFSAGNTGYNGARTVGSPGTNKNGLCVGASLNNYDSWRANTLDTGASKEHDIYSVAYFSSQGPTTDGRLKPDVVAPGWYVQSAAGVNNGSEYHCTIKGLSGTSMATPTVAGFAAKIRQYYRQGYYPSGTANSADAFTPSGALIKATLIHSGQPMSYVVHNTSRVDDISGSYPNNRQGYGRIQMDKVLNFGTSTTNPISMFVVGAASSSDANYAQISLLSLSQTYTFQTDSSATQSAIRITLCYTDYYSGSGSSGGLVNVLSVSVSDGHGHTFTPYVDSSTMVKSSVQVIDIDASSVVASSTYTVTVSATSVSQTQPFALVITGGLTYLTLTEPVKYTATQHSATYISHGATLDIIGLGILVFCIFALIYFFSRLTKRSRSLEIDPYAQVEATGLMGSIQRMRMAAIEKQRLATHHSPRSGSATNGKGKKKSPKHSSPRHQSPRAAGHRQAPVQDYEYNPADFE